MFDIKSTPVWSQVQSKTETKPNFDFKRVCEEPSVNFSVFDREKLSFEIKIFLSTHENVSNMLI